MVDKPAAREGRPGPSAGPTGLVFAPSPLLTVTIEPGAAEDTEIHLHAGGQGFWIARMMASLGVTVRLSATFGGESGHIVAGLIEREGVEPRPVAAAGANGTQVSDRRSGERVTVAAMAPAPLSRHEVDQLYDTTLVEGMEADVCVLGGPPTAEVLPADTYRRLAADLGANGTKVVADLGGAALSAVLEGGVSVLKVSHEELCADGWVKSDETTELVDAMEELVAGGAANVVVSRADAPALVLTEGRLLEVQVPALEPVDTHGAGDSMTAGLAAALSRGAALEDAVGLAAAAGALNVTRRGLATGRREEIERLAAHIEVRPMGSG